MRNIFTSFFWICLFLLKLHGLKAQCPTQNLPSTTNKGKFELDFKGTKYTIDGVINNKIQVCTNSTFTVTDKSGRTGIYYYFNTARTAFPTPTANYISTNTTLTYNTPATTGNYILIQVSYNTATRTVNAYVCQPIEVVAPTVNPKFTVSTCAAAQAQINIPTDPSNNFDSYTINWGDNTAVETIAKAQIPLLAKKHTYTNSNARTITVRGIKAGVLCDGVTTQGITPNGRSVSPTLFSLTVQDNDTIQVRYIGGNYSFDFYQKWGADNFRIVKNITSSTAALNTVKIAVKDADKEQYCYKVGITDACPRTTFSDSSCTIPLQVKALDKKNFLKWKTLTYPRFTSYRIAKNTTTNFKTITKATTDTLTDRPTVCGTTYSYQVIATAGSVQTLSRTISVIGVDSTKPPVITNILVSVEKEKVAITATIPTTQKVKAYTFYRWKNNKLESFNAGGNGNRVVDDKSSPNTQRECYKVAYENGCGIVSDTSSAYCPSYLTLEGAGIKWTEYQKFPLGLNAYYVEKLDDKGTVLTSTKVDKNLKFEPDPLSIDPTNPIVKFRVKALSTNSLVSYSNEVLYAQKLLMFMPDAFTPNSDGINDIFEIKALFVKEFKMRVYNRAGNVMFETEDYKTGWDGTYDGSTVPIGQYFYEIIASDHKGETTKKVGRIEVLY